MKRIKSVRSKRAMKKRKQRQEILAVAGAGILSLFLEMWKELHEFVVTRYRVNLPLYTETGESVKIAFLSDLHGRSYGKDNRDLIAAIAKERPDYILVGGDMLTRSEEETDQTVIRLLEELVKLCPVYMANGNHEQKMRLDPLKYGERYEDYRKAAEALGVHMLVNTTKHCDMKGIPVAISGLEVPLGCYAHFRTRKLTNTDITERIGSCGKKNYQILLAHSPVYFETYAKWGADLTLSGHLHGGIICIPGYGGLITPQARLFPKYAGGIYQKDDKVNVVSRGLGTHTVNIRLFNPAEVIMLTLCPESKNPTCV